MPPDVPELAIVLPFGSRTNRSMSSVGGAASRAFAAATRTVTTKSFFGGTIVSANRSQVGSMPLTLKQLNGFGTIHVRPAQVIVGESAEIAAPEVLAADSKGGAIGFVTISVMAVTVAIMIRFTSIHSFRAMRASGTNGAIVSPLSLSGSAADGAVLSKQFLWKV